MKRKFLNILLFLILVIIVGAFYLTVERAAEHYQSQQIAESLLKQVSLGMPRSMAIALLEDAAWHHATCEYSEHYIEDLFLYGNHNLSLTGSILLKSELTDNELIVTFIGVEENYRLFLYDHCSSLNLAKP